MIWSVALAVVAASKSKLARSDLMLNTIAGFSLFLQAVAVQIAYGKKITLSTLSKANSAARTDRRGTPSRNSDTQSCIYIIH